MAYKPEFPYRGKQIIIDSDRVLLNSKNDATFIVGNKAVGISSSGTINLDSSGDCIINSPSIKLGLTAKHPLVKGDVLQSILQEFIKILDELVADNLSKSVESNGAKMVSVQLAGDALSKACANLSNRLAEITSLNNYTE
jgi:hypothetical protein